MYSIIDQHKHIEDEDRVYWNDSVFMSGLKSGFAWKSQAKDDDKRPGASYNRFLQILAAPNGKSLVH